LYLPVSNPSGSMRRHAGSESPVWSFGVALLRRKPKLTERLACPRDKVVAQRMNIMKRRTMLMLMLLGLGIASFPQVAPAQSSPLIGTSKLNVEKSKSEHAKSTSARRHAGLGGRGAPQPTPAQTEDAIERFMHATGCSRELAARALRTPEPWCGPLSVGN
jgi:hypothetical protein